MEKERVNFGENYWCIDEYFDVYYCPDFDVSDDYTRFKVGNYFGTKEEAEAMANKLRAVLSGADVIQWPSDEEIDTNVTEIGDKFSKDVEIASQYACSAEIMAKWLKSKIIK